MELVFVTGNENKLREARQILGAEIEGSALDIHEIQAIDVEEVVRDKARRAFDILQKPLIVEDTGLYIRDYNNFPGALVKWLVKFVGRDEMARLFAGKSVTAECCVCFNDGSQMKVFRGQVNGKIADAPRGQSGFGWDPIFIPEGYEKSFAEMGAEEKNKISHRGEAFRNLAKWMNKE